LRHRVPLPINSLW